MGKVRFDKQKLRVVMATEGIATVPVLAEMAALNKNIIYQMCSSGRFSLDALEALGNALEINPIDFLTTEGFPDPRIGRPGRPWRGGGSFQ